MTVEELIEKLKTFNPKAEVITPTNDESLIYTDTLFISPCVAEQRHGYRIRQYVGPVSDYNAVAIE